MSAILLKHVDVALGIRENHICFHESSSKEEFIIASAYIRSLLSSNYLVLERWLSSLKDNCQSAIAASSEPAVPCISLKATAIGRMDTGLTEILRLVACKLPRAANYDQLYIQMHLETAKVVESEDENLCDIRMSFPQFVCQGENCVPLVSTAIVVT